VPRFKPHGYIRTFHDLAKVTPSAAAVETFTNPLAAVHDRLITHATVMKVGLYTVLNGGISADGYAHPVSLIRTADGTGDTPGTVKFTGTDRQGGTITETLTVSGTNTTTVNGTKCFQTVTSIEGIGWVQAGGASDLIDCGFGAIVGLGQAASADTDILNVYDAGSLATTASFAGKGGGTVSSTYFTPTGANGTLDFTVVYQPAQSTALLAATAATISTSAALGFDAEVDEFGFRISSALAGTGGTLTFTLCDASGNVIATLTPTLATGTAGTTVKTNTIIEAYKHLYDASTLVLKRTATGTAFTAGGGSFYVRLRQRTQA